MVLDASITLAALLDDEVTEAAQNLLERVSRDGAIVPVLWPLEVANALHIAARRGRCDNAHVDRALGNLANFPIVIDHETGVHAWTHTLALARAEELTVYDAAYLELAIRRKLPLASYDNALIRAAQRRGLAVMTGGE